ncbi:MAG: hypothetical protein FWG08_01870 [Propionibacteriaceae bacterium]|nr:hypothetical protein [Propionibacteriaceae bacterium]
MYGKVRKPPKLSRREMVTELDHVDGERNLVEIARVLGYNPVTLSTKLRRWVRELENEYKKEERQ